MKGKLTRDCLELLFMFLSVISIIQSQPAGPVGEQVAPGKCPDYPSHPNFSASEFKGIWFVANQFQRKQRFLECQKLKFTPMTNNEHSFKIKGSVRATYSLVLETNGESYTPNVSNPAFMRWSWDYFPSFIDQVTVLDTDYDNYAVIILCHDYSIFHTRYPILMMREKPLNVTDAYKIYYKRAEKIFPFPVFTRWAILQSCYLDRLYPEAEVRLLDIDKTIKDINNFSSKLI